MALVLLDPFPALPERTILARGGRTFAASFVLPGSVLAVAAAEVDDDDPVAFDLPMSSALGLRSRLRDRMRGWFCRRQAYACASIACRE